MPVILCNNVQKCCPPDWWRGAPALSFAQPPNAVLDVPYSFTFTVIGGTGPFTFSIEGAPPELFIDPDTGELSGMPIVTGTFEVTVTVTDVFGHSAHSSYPFIVEFPGSDVPVITGGAILLQADDLTWHRVFLATDDGVAIEVEQTASPDPGTRGYFIWEADDATKHRTDLALDEGSYTLNIDQSNSAEDSDYITLALAIEPAFAVFHNVTLTLDELYTESVNQTPNP